MDNPNSINSLIADNFKIYPNPAKGKLTINLPNNVNEANITILDITGKQYLNKKINSQNETIDLIDIPKGIYFVRIESENESIVKKLIVE